MGTQVIPNPAHRSVYQDTVWGPPLWNCHHEDARHAVNTSSFTDTIFADDLKCFKQFDKTVLDSEVQAELPQCQQSLHNWCAANQVIFDAAKKSFHILHP